MTAADGTSPWAGISMQPSMVRTPPNDLRPFPRRVAWPDWGRARLGVGLGQLRPSSAAVLDIAAGNGWRRGKRALGPWMVKVRLRLDLGAGRFGPLI
jgi:hypothetical protein